METFTERSFWLITLIGTGTDPVTHHGRVKWTAVEAEPMDFEPKSD
jgi:hypothetical protein